MSDNDRKSKKQKVDSPTDSQSEDNTIGLADLSGFNEQQIAQLQKMFRRQELQHNKLLGRFNCLVSVLGPATLYAKFETAVYTFVDPSIQHDWRFKEDNIKFATSNICFDVFQALKNNDTSATFQWNGPSSKVKKGNTSFPKESRFPLIKAGLQGATAFIGRSTESDVQALDKAHRNKIVHNGSFLDSMFGSPKIDDMKGDGFENAKVEVRNFQQALQELAAEVSPLHNSDFTACIEGLAAALKQKRIIAENNTKTQAISKLNDLVGISTATSSSASASSTGNASVKAGA